MGFSGGLLCRLLGWILMLELFYLRVDDWVLVLHYCSGTEAVVVAAWAPRGQAILTRQRGHTVEIWENGGLTLVL